MNTRDRLEALRRTPEYQEDFKKWRELKERLYKNRNKKPGKDLEELKTLEGKIKKRWKVTFSFPSPPGFQYAGWDEEKPRGFPAKIFEDEFGVRVIHPNAATQQIEIGFVIENYDPLWYQMEYNRSVKVDEKGVTVEIKPPFKKKHKGGKHICIVIDLTRPKKDLLREFERNITFYKKIIPKEKKRNKLTSLNPWDVYDKVHRNELTLNQIAQGKSGKGSFDNPNHKAYYGCVKRAYNHALKMINQTKT